MSIIDRFEQWLDEVNNSNWSKETNREVLLKERGKEYIQEIKERLREDFIVYRYRFVDNKIAKEEFLVVTDEWYVRNINRLHCRYKEPCYIQTYFKSVNVEDNYSPIRISTKNLNTLNWQSCFFDYENDKEVYEFFLNREIERQNKALKELNTAQNRIKMLQEVLVLYEN